MASTLSANPATRGHGASRRWLTGAVRLHAAAFRSAALAVSPVVDLLLRLWLAQSFFVSGALKLVNWQSALELAQTEYPVSWMSPVVAAWIGVTIEVGGAVLLAIGLFARPAALAMLVLALVGQFAYQAFDVQQIGRAHV